MKKTQKKILGAFGLSVVVATTVFAAFLPTPVTQATGGTITDTVTVRVVGPGPDVTITDETSGESEVKPDKTIHYDYSGAKIIEITLEYTDKDGNKTTEVLDTFDADYETGSGDLNLDLGQPEYGYGDYIIKITGSGTGGVEDIDIIDFSFVPVTGTAEESKTVDGADVTLQYDPDNDDIASFEINVYDKDGNKIDGLSPTIVTPPDTQFSLDFGKYGLDDGLYIITVNALDANGEPLYKPYPIEFNYKTEPYVVPDTGGVFQGLNISRSDYLVTGLVVFGIIAMAGLYFVAKNSKSARRGNRRK